MKTYRLKTGVMFASWAMLLIFGCHKKKPPIPPQEAPPTISTTQQQTPPQTQSGQETQPQNPAPAQQTPETANNKPPEKQPPPHHAKRPAPKKPADEKPPTEVAKNTPPPPPRVVIQEGGTNPGNGQVSGTGADNNSQKTTQQLLDHAEANLKSINRQLTTEEQATVTQIRDWIKQSKEATKDGDLALAHNLALKAQLTSDDLVKRK